MHHTLYARNGNGYCISKILLVDLPAFAAQLHNASDAPDSARQHFYHLLDHAWAQVLKGRQQEDGEGEGDSAALQAASLTLVNVARTAVDALYPYCGLGAAREASDINRVWRDLHTATQHALLVP